MSKLLELLFLQQIKGFGKVKINKMLGTVEQSENLDQLCESLLSNTKLKKEDLSLARSSAEKQFKDLKQQKEINILTVFDTDYPQGFLSLGVKKPVIIYVMGDASILNSPGVSVVGTRHPSPWTMKFGQNISKQIGLVTGRIIVSGLALGCDKFAHEGALLAGVPTVAILPAGLNVITPSSHKRLAADIVNKGGCLLSEYSPDTKAFRATYIERDGLIAAMTDTTFVIECAEKSGTMHTVEAAQKIGRRLACYYPDQNALLRGARENDYLGNKKMIDEMDASIISRQTDFKSFFEELENKETDTNKEVGGETYQMAFSDLLDDGNIRGNKEMDDDES